MFQELLDTILQGVQPHDQIRFVLRTAQLEYPIVIPFMLRQRLATERALAEIQRVVQSNMQFRLNESVNVNLTHVEMPQGGKGTKRSDIDLGKHLAEKKSIVHIQNKDELCLARALVVAKAKIDNDKQYKCIADYRKPMQVRFARVLHQKANVPIGPCGLDQVKQFQTYLIEYQINIVSKELQNTLLYVGPEKEKKMYLYLHDDHYDVITSIPGFLARNRYCHTCKKAYDHWVEHMCPGMCPCCRFIDCPSVSSMHCGECNRLFKSQECFDRHKQATENAKSICASLVKCLECHTVVRRCKEAPEKHHCGMVKCKACDEYVRPADHRCYMQPATQNNDAEGYNLLFFDFECNHEPNLCVVQNEAGNERVFRGDNTRDEFCQWLFTKEHSKCIVVAHHFQACDSYFILQYLHQNGVQYDVIMRATKVPTLSVDMLKIN